MDGVGGIIGEVLKFNGETDVLFTINGCVGDTLCGSTGSLLSVSETDGSAITVAVVAADAAIDGAGGGGDDGVAVVVAAVIIVVVCGIVGTTGATGSGVFNNCGVDAGAVAVDVAVLVVGVFVADATDCLRERPIRFTCVDGTPMLY